MQPRVREIEGVKNRLSLKKSGFLPVFPAVFEGVGYAARSARVAQLAAQPASSGPLRLENIVCKQTEVRVEGRVLIMSIQAWFHYRTLSSSVTDDARVRFGGPCGNFKYPLPLRSR